MKTKLTFLLTKILQHKEYLVIYFLLFITYICLLPKTGHGGDFYCWGEWTKYIFTHGLSNAYKSGTNYLPLYQYFMFLFGKIQGSEEYIIRNIFYIKIFAVIFDFIAVFFVLKLVQEYFRNIHKTFIYSLFLLLNVSFIYNGLIWGQVDGIMTCLIFIAFFLALKQRVTGSLIFLVLSLNFKLQSIIFVPILGLMLLPAMMKQFSLKKILTWISVIALVQALIVLPFWIAGDIEKVWKVVSNSVDNFPFISMNAYNMWYWFFSGDLLHTSDGILFWGVTCKQWGQMLFYAGSALALFPLLKDVFYIVFYKRTLKLSMKKLLIASSLIPLLFFFLNTQMHERYVHPAIIFLAAYALLYKRYFPYIIISIAYFLNMEGVLQYMQLKNYKTALFHPAFVAFLFLVCIVYLFLELYEIRFSRSKDPKLLKRESSCFYF